MENTSTSYFASPVPLCYQKWPLKMYALVVVKLIGYKFTKRLPCRITLKFLLELLLFKALQNGFYIVSGSIRAISKK